MSIIPSTPRGHVVTLTLAAWGHAKAACALVTKIVRLGGAHATIVTPESFYDRIKKEVARSFVPGKEDYLRDLIRVSAIECSPLPNDTTALTANFLEYYKRLLDGKAIKILPNEDATYSSIIPPQLLIMDFFTYDAMRGVRQASGRSVPIYSLQSVSAAALLLLWGPEDIGGGGDLLEKLGSLRDTGDEETNNMADKIYRRIHGELIKIPGIPPMYDHEFSPQKLFLPFTVAFMNARAHRFFNESDGCIMNTNEIYEKEAIDAVRQWFGDRPVICPAPFDYPVTEVPKSDLSTIKQGVNAFLDNALKKHGARSVIYMSFGTAWWTTEPEKVWTTIDIFIELEIPFVFAFATPFAELPEDIEKKIKESGLGYWSKWLPQTSILQHEACGWFVTHCGHNSVMEALTEGVPLICWPFDVDQPINATLISDVHNAGYELFEIRSSHGLEPVYRLGGRKPEGTVEALRAELKDILAKTFGEDGKVKRANAQRLGDEFAKSWKSDGYSWTEIQRIVDILH